MRALVVADTHLRAGGPRRLPEQVLRLAGASDVVLHAGDVLDQGVLDELAALAPTHAVLGNNDISLVGVLPQRRVLELGGVTVAMIHDSGSAAGRAARLSRAFPDAAVVVFGHSHIPWNERGLNGQLLFNPGSPTQRRAQPHHTVGLLELAGGQIRSHRIEVIDQ